VSASLNSCSVGERGSEKGRLRKPLAPADVLVLLCIIIAGHQPQIPSSENFVGSARTRDCVVSARRNFKYTDGVDRLVGRKNPHRAASSCAASSTASPERNTSVLAVLSYWRSVGPGFAERHVHVRLKCLRSWRHLAHVHRPLDCERPVAAWTIRINDP